jgi:hypothetical protein
MDNFAELCPDYKTQVGGKMLEATSFFNTGKILRNRVGESKIVDGICRCDRRCHHPQVNPRRSHRRLPRQPLKDSLGADEIKQA